MRFGSAGWFYCWAAYFDSLKDELLLAANKTDIHNGVLPADFLEPKRHSDEWDWPERGAYAR